MNLAERIYYTFQESAQAKLSAADILAEPIAQAAERLVNCFMNEGKLLACGNGASAADAQHFVSELINRFERERPALAALALCGDSATLTSIADDSDFSMVFARQISALGQPGDILLAVSTNGCSRNVIEATRAAEKPAEYLAKEDWANIPKRDIPALIERLRKEMREAAKNLEFERAADLRDLVFELEKRK